MNPMTLSAAVYDVFQSSYTLSYRFLNNQSSTSPRQIHSKLDAERKSTEAWANEVRSINVKKLRETFPPEEYDRILDALGELRYNFEKASQELERVDHKGKPLPNAGLLNKDYDELESLLSRLTAANDALQQLVPPPVSPPISPPTYSPGPGERSSRRRRQRTLEGDAMDMTHIQESVRPSSIPPVSSIYRTTHEALVTISFRRSDHKIARSASRLKLWGAGLFDMAIRLDTVFDSDRDAFRPVRQGILRILADILVWAEQELNELSEDGQNTERSHDRQSAKQVTALLGTDELLPMALESWKDSVDQHEYFEAGHIPNTNFNPVPGLVEILFDLLPAVRAARETYFSSPMEAEILEDNGTNAPAALRSPMFDESYIDSANLKFDQVNDIFKMIDKIVKKDSRPSYTLRLQSEREALGRFHADRRSAKGVDTKHLEDLFEKQKQLVRKLDEFIANSSGASNPRVPLGFIWKRQGTSIERHATRVESFLLFLADTNSSMRDVMHGRGRRFETMTRG